MKTEEKNKKKKGRKRVRAILVCLGAGGILHGLAKGVPGFGEWYADRVYPVFVSALGRFSGMFPWSVVELGLYLFLLLLAGSLLYVLGGMLSGKTERKSMGSWLLSWGTVGAALLLAYTLLCGINYWRDSFASQAGFVREAYPVSELVKLCRDLTDEVNRQSSLVERDQEERMVLSGEERREAVEAMERLGETYPAIKGYYPRPKGLLMPWILGIQSLSGIYSPFTVEANYNSEMPDYNIPFTACHELSHLRGFMEEEEANFIAYLACIESEEPEFRYSGNLLAWIYSMNALYEADPDTWSSIRQELADEVEADLAANHSYWQQYEGPVAQVSNKVNDTYLKANGQQDGVRSYDKMVDLLVAYRKTL